MNVHKLFAQAPHRPLKKESWLRDLLQEHHLNTRDFVLPIFVREPHHPKDIKGLPGVNRYTIEELLSFGKILADKGVKAIALFPFTDNESRSYHAREAFNDNNLICRALRALKKENFPFGIVADVALDPYTNHGHDGLLRDGVVDNARTVEALVQQAETLAYNGADILAPSDMMDGRISAIRKKLDKHDFQGIPLLSYIKFSSAFYGPFREAVGVESTNINKDTYQINTANHNIAISRLKADVNDGASMVMIKPALPYIDVLKSASEQVHVPVFAYHVSGEYAALKFAAEAGAIDYDRAVMESMLSLKRAGARAIFSYSALDCIDIINQI